MNVAATAAVHGNYWQPTTKAGTEGSPPDLPAFVVSTPDTGFGHIVT